jgi:hypothetical protein
MAYVPAGAQGVSVTFEDRDKNSSSVAFFAPAAVVAADITTFATTTLPTTLGALSDASIRRLTVTRTFENDAFVVPPESCDIERKGMFVWRAADRSTSKNEIPSIKNTLVIDGSNLLNIADPLVSAFIAMMVDTGLLDVYGLGNYRAQKLIETASAPRKIHRANSRG